MVPAHGKPEPKVRYESGCAETVAPSNLDIQFSNKKWNNTLIEGLVVD